MSTIAPSPRQARAAMARRGLGARRVAGALREAGIDEDDAEAIAPAIADRAVDAALAFARRKRIGPFAHRRRPIGRLREKQIAAMLRAGHRFDLARRIVAWRRATIRSAENRWISTERSQRIRCDCDEPC